MKGKIMRKKIMVVVLSLCLVFAFGLTGCVDDGGSGGGGGATSGDFAQPARDIDKDSLKVAYIPLGASGPTVPLVMKAYEDAIGSRDIKVDIFDSQFDTTTQLNIMNECITQKYDAIILEANDQSALNDVIVEAEKAGIPVITRNLAASGSYTAHMMCSDYSSGWEAAEYIQANAGVPDNAKAIILDVVPEIKPTNRMGTAFQDFLEQNTQWELIDIQSIENTSQENGNTVMRDLLTKHDDIDIVYCVNDAVAMGAAQAIESAGRTSDGIIVWGFAGYGHVLQAIKDGGSGIYGTSYADEYQLCFAIMNNVLWYMQTGVTGEKLGFEYFPTIEIKTFPVTTENFEEVMRYTRWDWHPE